MDQMAGDFSGQAHFIFVYCREAHPDTHPDHPVHRSWEQKVQHARDMQQRHNTPRTIVVDALDGDVHRRFGGLPNMSWVIDHSGRVVYKAEWTVAQDIRSTLEEIIRAREQKRGGGITEYYRETIAYKSGRPSQEPREASIPTETVARSSA